MLSESMGLEESGFRGQLPGQGFLCNQMESPDTSSSGAARVGPVLTL